jgi:hypothetical protein
MNSPILPLFKKNCDNITVLSIGYINPEFKFKGLISSIPRLLEFVTLGSELTSLSWASHVCNNLQLYHAPCKNINILDFNKIKALLEEGIKTWMIGPVDPNKFLFQFDVDMDYNSRVKIY